MEADLKEVRGEYREFRIDNENNKRENSRLNEENAKLKEEVKEVDLDKFTAEYQKLRGEYFDESNNTFKVKMPRNKKERFLILQPIIDDYISLQQNHGIPANSDDLKYFKKKAFGNREYFEVPGFQSEYFGPRESLLMGGHYFGKSE